MMSLRLKVFLALVLVISVVVILLLQTKYRPSSTNETDFPAGPADNYGTNTYSTPKKHLMAFSDTKSNVKKESGKKRRFPDAIIIGVKKGGTRALIEMLSTHPAIKITEREMQFFSRQYDKGLKWYISQMPLASANKIVMEKSPSYFSSPSAPKRIHDQSKPVKIILIVRNPVDRAISDYVHNKDEHNSNLPKFEDMVMKNGEVNPNATLGLLSKSLYDIHFKRWLRWFDRNQILVLNGDKLIHQPVSVLKQAENFLHIKNFFKKELFFVNRTNGFYCWKKKPGSRKPICLGASKGRPHPKVDETVIQKLNAFFRPHMANFCRLASVNFSWCKL